MNEIINGGDLMIFISDPVTGKEKPIAFATSHKMSVNRETTETTSKNSFGNWVQKSPKKMSWTMTTENLFSQPFDIELETKEGHTPDYLFNAMVNGTVLQIFIDRGSRSSENSPITPGDSVRFLGKAIVTSYELNAPNGDNATYSATFEGVGELESVDI